MTAITESPLAERVHNTASAAQFLARHLQDGRNYVHVLNDLRRGRRRSGIPSTRRGPQVYYREVDLLLFIDAERQRGVRGRPTVLVEDDELLSYDEMFNIENRLKNLVALRDSANDAIARINAILEDEKEVA